MDIDTINYTAENQLLSNLCLQYYNEVNPEKKRVLFEQIQILYIKKMRDK